MNINSELWALYTRAKEDNQFDLAFRIISCLAKMKPTTLSISGLSNEDIAKLIDECALIAADI